MNTQLKKYYVLIVILQPMNINNLYKREGLALTCLKTLFFDR
jgi:hypothetical protein